MMKVLFLVNTPSPYRVDFFNELGKLCDLTVLFETTNARTRDSKWTAEKFSNFKAKFLKGVRIGDAEAFCPGVIRYLSCKKYDIIVVGMYSSPTGMLAVWHMKHRHIPFVLSTDGGMKKQDSGFKHRLKEYFIGSASAWLSTGKTTTDYLKYYGADESRVYQYPFTSVRQKDILKRIVSDSEKKELRQKLNMTEAKIVISVGQFIYRKGYDILLNSCRNLNKNIGIYIIGGKPTEEYLALREKHNLTNVHFVDFMNKDELSEYYKAADLFILPTREDIWGLVVNEAMAYGLPVITTDKCVAGVEMIQPKKNGILVPAEDSKALAEAICRAFDIDSQEALNTAKEYTIENMAIKHMQVFGKIIKKY